MRIEQNWYLCVGITIVGVATEFYSRLRSDWWWWSDSLAPSHLDIAQVVTKAML